MSYSFSDRSLNQLKSCHEDLIDLCTYCIDHINFIVIEGHRGKEKQNKMFESGKSELKYPESKHNNKPSLAVDLVPYPVSWEKTERMVFQKGFFWGVAEKMGIDIRIGVDWDQDGVLVPNDDDESFCDYPHIELA